MESSWSASTDLDDSAVEFIGKELDQASFIALIPVFDTARGVAGQFVVEGSWAANAGINFKTRPRTLIEREATVTLRITGMDIDLRTIFPAATLLAQWLPVVKPVR
jgi:hypothetical protein